MGFQLTSAGCVEKAFDLPVINYVWPLVSGRDYQGSPSPATTPDLCFQFVVAEEDQMGSSGP